MEAIAIPLLAMSVCALLLLALHLPQVRSIDDDDDITEEDVLRTAEMYSRLYDDPDFVKDMGLADEEQRRLND